MKIIIAGPPRSGKSCLREGLKQAIMRVPGAPYPYVITACPDGEGSWFQETVNADAELAARCKAEYKSGFSPEFVKRIADSVKNCELPLILVDIGGMPSKENRAICSSATYAILLTGDISRLQEWRKFCQGLDITIIAEVSSDYHGTEDTVPVLEQDGIRRGSVHYLERGEMISDRPTIKTLAHLLIEMSPKG